MTDTALHPSPPAARRTVRVSAGAIATTIARVLPVFLVGGLAVQMGHDLHFSPAGLGLAVSVYFGISALASVPSGALVERYGSALVARAGILLSAGSLLAVAALARSYPVLVALLGLSAAANALGQLASNAALARHVPTHRQGLSFGVKQAAIPVSTLLAGAAVPTIALTAGWRWAFVAAAGRPWPHCRPYRRRSVPQRGARRPDGPDGRRWRWSWSAWPPPWPPPPRTRWAPSWWTPRPAGGSPRRWPASP
ncbi:MULTISPECIES: MFS transporter [Micromonospora]|uniref:MFS transporter n=1 Tax=Micromonospora TaxID=1873 RepID=UPI001EF863D1|nr:MULTISPECIES: MFS transporter [Micromonospora]